MKMPYILPAVAALLSACAYHPPGWDTKLLGDPAPLTAATETIVIQPGTKWVNVTGGDIVRFDVDGKSFAWTFNVARSVQSFDLSQVAPPGVLNRQVVAYIAPDPRYRNGGGNDREGSQ